MNLEFDKLIIPKNIENILLEDGGWETDKYSPFFIDIDLTDAEKEEDILYSFQFNPCGKDFYAMNKKIEKKGFDSDGYGWEEFLFQEIEQLDESIINDIDSDSEAETCCFVTTNKDSFYKILSHLAVIFNKRFFSRSA